MKNKKKLVINTFLVLFGTFLLALAVQIFILPYNILSGGVAGIAVAIEPFIHVDTTLMANVLVMVLFLLGWAVLGKEFAINTFLSSISYPVFMNMIKVWNVQLSIEPFLASFYGGLVGGIGIGLVMRTGASTGGMDVPPLIVHKLTGIKISMLVLFTDAFTVLLGLAAYDLSSVLVGFLSVFATSYGINWVLTAEGSVSKSVQIISPKYQEIADAVQTRLSRGTTIMEATGGYTHQPKHVLLCVVSQNQYNELIEIIDEFDTTAFVITTDATDMHGMGFSFKFRV